MSNKRIGNWVIAALFATSIGAPVVAASEKKPRQAASTSSVWRARVETRVGDGGTGEVYVNDMLVIRLRTTAGGVTPLRRAEITAERLNAAIGAGLTAGNVVADVRSDPGNPRLKFGGQLIASVDKIEARASDSSPASVVRGWASALKNALSVPGIAVSDKDILIPLGESRPLRLRGAARGDLRITAASGRATIADSATPDESSASVVSVSPDASGTLLNLRGVTPGRETLTLEREGATVSVSVRVQPYAGQFVPPKPVIITGKGTPIERVARYAAASATVSAVTTPGAIARVQADSVTVAMPLTPGATSTVTVPVTVTGVDMIPVSRTVSVPLRNEALPPVATDTLLYSNNPERVLSLGTLFAARLPISDPAKPSATRLLYHHQSALPQDAWFSVELLNDSDTPSQVQVVGGGAGPVRDTVWVGYRAASDFVRDYLADAGLIIEVPAKSRVSLLSARLPVGLTVSGLMQLRPVSGPAPLVRVAAEQVGDTRAQLETWQPAPLLPGELAKTQGGGLAYSLSDHIYPNPVKKIDAKYEVGGNWAFIGIGNEPLAGTHNAERKLFGNYGVWYEITGTISNPTDKQAKVRAVFTPSAGLAGGVFLVDGGYVEVPQTNLPKEPVLSTYLLAPGETRTIKITTLPLSGSNYPARIVIRP